MGAADIRHLALFCVAVLLWSEGNIGAGADTNNTSGENQETPKPDVVVVNMPSNLAENTPAYTILDEKPDMQTTRESGTSKEEKGDSGWTFTKDNKACIYAKFQASFVIKYYQKSGKNSIITTTKVDMPEDLEVGGICGDDTSSIMFSWNPGNYTLTIDFVKRSLKTINDDRVVLSTWTANSITLTFNTETDDSYQNPVSPGIHIVKTSWNQSYFSAPSNFSYSCANREDMKLHEYQNGTESKDAIDAVDMSVWKVKIQAFDMPPSGKIGPVAECGKDVLQDIPHQNIVPIAVAAALAGLIAIVVIGYFFYKNRRHSPYRSMEE